MATEFTFRLNNNGGLTVVALPGFADIASTVQQEIQNKYGYVVDLVVPAFDLRASGEPFIKLRKEHLGGHDVVAITSGPGTYEMLGQLQLLLHYLKARRARRIAVVTAYSPLGRSDKDEGMDELALIPHVIHSLRSAAYGQLDRIMTVDMHSPQSVMAAGEMGIITPYSMARHVLRAAIRDTISERGKVCLMLPDDGARKRFKDAIDRLEAEFAETFPIVVGQKIRTSSTESRSIGFFGDVEKMRGATVISFDDEIGTGKTTIDAATSAKKQFHAKKFINAIIHGVFCKNAPELFGDPRCPVSRTYVTDTIPILSRPKLKALVDKGRIRVVTWAHELAEIVHLHHWDESTREIC
ncbi:MAG: hypothetical protein NTW66_00360 [Candidatus Magasanikbacteria bacterium]|nr:hypothetical protein [Candidatus Magasanikbacteria bacterium]